MDSEHIARNTIELPPAYREHRAVNFKRDRKFAVAVQAIFALVAVLAVAVALWFALPLRGQWSPAVTVIVTLLACLLYMAAHEATHGVVLHLMTGSKPSYAVRFPFLETGSRAYLTRRQAVMVALAPCAFWGVVLTAALLTLPTDYLLTAYILVALNFAGSAGDFAEVYLVSREQRGALLQDDGGVLRIFVLMGQR